MARERLADLDDSKDDEREKKRKLQEKNRRAQQAFRMRQKSKIQELSDHVAVLEAQNSSHAIQMQDLLQTKAMLESALKSQSAQLKRLSTEYAAARGRSVSNLYIPTSATQFDPSDDIVLKYPVTAANGCAEHIKIPSSDITSGAGLEQVSKLFTEQWLPQLVQMNQEYEDLLAKKASAGQNKSRTKSALQQDTAKELERIEEKCRRIQHDVFECWVKLLRSQPVRSRIVSTDVLFNCHARLAPEAAWRQAEGVVDGMNMSEDELDKSVALYETYLCKMAMLRVQRVNMLRQLQKAYDLSDAEWLANQSSEQATMKQHLSASATIETLGIMLHKETELYCGLMTGVAMEVWRPVTFMRNMILGAPGMVDFLTLLEVVRSRRKPMQGVLEVTAEYTKASLTAAPSMDAGRHSTDVNLLTGSNGKVAGVPLPVGLSAGGEGLRGAANTSDLMPDGMVLDKSAAEAVLTQGLHSSKGLPHLDLDGHLLRASAAAPAGKSLNAMDIDLEPAALKKAAPAADPGGRGEFWAPPSNASLAAHGLSQNFAQQNAPAPAASAPAGVAHAMAPTLSQAPFKQSLRPSNVDLPMPKLEISQLDAPPVSSNPSLSALLDLRPLTPPQDMTAITRSGNLADISWLTNSHIGGAGAGTGAGDTDLSNFLDGLLGGSGSLPNPLDMADVVNRVRKSLSLIGDLSGGQHSAQNGLPHSGGLPGVSAASPLSNEMRGGGGAGAGGVSLPSSLAPERFRHLQPPGMLGHATSMAMGRSAMHTDKAPLQSAGLLSGLPGGMARGGMVGQGMMQSGTAATHAPHTSRPGGSQAGDMHGMQHRAAGMPGHMNDVHSHYMPPASRPGSMHTERANSDRQPQGGLLRSTPAELAMQYQEFMGEPI